MIQKNLQISQIFIYENLLLSDVFEQPNNKPGVRGEGAGRNSVPPGVSEDASWSLVPRFSRVPAARL